MRARLVRVAIAAVLVAAAPVLTGCGGDEGPRCVEPVLRVVGEGAPGKRAIPVDGTVPLTVAGSGFGRGCVPEGRGAGKGSEVRPLERVQLFLRQGTRVTSVARVAADEALELRVTFGVPPGYAAGPAEILATTTVDPDDAPLATTELILGDA